MLHLKSQNTLHYTLRFASAMCFIGHGAFGIITKPVWVNYFAVFGIGHDMAYTLMPIVGTIDILMGISLLIFPTRAIALWLVLWGLTTAALRPLSGEPFPEMIERAGNYGAPLAMLLIAGVGSISFKALFAPIDPDTPLDSVILKKVTTVLKVVVFLLLIGHGWLNLVEKKALLGQYATLGFSNPAQVAHIAGIFEIAGGLSVLIRPFRPVLIALLVWKMGTELFYPKWEIFEWVERGGSYSALLALWFALKPEALGVLSDKVKPVHQPTF